MDITYIKKFLPFRKQLYKLKKSYLGKEKRVSYGLENPNISFYVIGQEDTCGGLFWLINKVVMHIGYAIDKGYIPVVDFLHYKTQYSTKENYGKINLWELFFEQPCGYNLEAIGNSKNIIINKMTPAPHKKYLMGQYEFYNQPKRIEYFRDIFHKYIKFNKTTKSILTKTYNDITKGETNIIGVLCRGTDYIILKPKGHPIQPSQEMVVEDVRNTMKKYNCRYVFLATEDEDIFQYFKQQFGQQLLFLEQERTSKNNMSGDKYLAQERELDKKRNPYDDAIKYLSAIYILSRCKCFIGGCTGGTKGVLLMTKGFEYNKIYNLGLYK